MRSGSRGPAAALVTALAFALPFPAGADSQLWLETERRLLLVGSPDEPPRLSLRFFSEARFSLDAQGLDLAAFRLGPLWRPVGWFYLAAHGRFAGEQGDGDRFLPEYRAEVEPNFEVPLGRWQISSRSRFEVIWSEGERTQRLRQQLWAAWEVVEGLRPLAAAEVFFTGGEGFSQHRFRVGLGVDVGAFDRLDVSYLFIRREESGWAPIHVVEVALVPSFGT